MNHISYHIKSYLIWYLTGSFYSTALNSTMPFWTSIVFCSNKSFDTISSYYFDVANIKSLMLVSLVLLWYNNHLCAWFKLTHHVAISLCTSRHISSYITSSCLLYHVMLYYIISYYISLLYRSVWYFIKIINLIW